MDNKVSKLEKKRQRAQAAADDLAITLLQEKEVERKRRNGRLIKLGTIALQFFEAGDSVLLERFEEAVTKQFAGRKVDRLDFGLDDPETWFDRLREDLLTSAPKPKEQSPSAPAPSPRAAAPTPAQSPASQSPSGAPKAANPPAKPAGANGSAPASTGAPPSTASA